MAYTAQQIIDMAAERSNLNDPDLIPTAELLDYITNFERHAFLLAAKWNPDYFGKEGNTSARSASTESWSLTANPGNIAAVSRVEIASITGSVSGLSIGDQVYVVSIRNPHVEPSPRVYIRNKTVYEYNEELQADSSNYVIRLKIFYSYLPVDKTGLSDNIELPDEFSSLLVLPLARTMALRDQRPEEAQVLNQEFQFALRTFIEEVSVFDEATTRELAQTSASIPQLQVADNA